MTLDTQTFALSRWWARAALKRLSLESTLFSAANMRSTRMELIAGKNQISAIRNWLVASQLISRDGNRYEVSRFARHILHVDPELSRSSTWWAFHLLTCLGPDPFPYDALFRCIDTDLRTSISSKELIRRLVEEGPGRAQDTVETYVQGVLKMFRDDGPLEGLGLLETRRVRNGEDRETFFRIGSPNVPNEAILFAIALTRSRHFASRTSVDFAELTGKSVDHFLTLSQDEFRRRIREISSDRQWSDLLQFTDQANLESISFGQYLKPEGMLIKLLKDGGDSWQ